MGTSTSTQTLQHLQSISDPHFGEVDLFKTSQIAHLMKKTFTFVQRSQVYHKVLSNLKFMQEVRHSSLVPVHQLVHKQQKHLCIQYDVIEAYVQYYNFTLKSIIEAGRKLTRQEIWYILLQLSDLAILLKQNKIKFKFDVDNIFITLSGIPCIYLFDSIYAFNNDFECEGVNSQNLTKQILQSYNVLAVSLANTVLNLAEYDTDEKQQFKALKQLDINLYDLISRMKMFEIELQELPEIISSILASKRIIVGKTLSVTTKFMNQLKKQTTQTNTQSRQKIRQKEKQKEKEKEKQRLKDKQIQKQKEMMSCTLPSSNTVSLQFPSKFLVIQQTLKGIDQKKRNNSQKQQIMKKRMQQILSKENSNKKGDSFKQSGIKQKQNTIKIGKGTNSLSISTVTSRQSLNSSQQIKPMRSSILWKRKALELIKKEH